MTREEYIRRELADHDRDVRWSKWLIIGAVVLVLAFVVYADARAQAIPWNTDVLAWTAPTQCSDGSPVVGNCDITAYKVETATSATGTWSTLTTTIGSVLTYTADNLAAGTHCYRVSAISSGGASAPSAIACATATPPLPGPPTLKTIDTLAYEVQKATDALKLAVVGTVPLDTPCTSDEANGLHVVPRKAVTVSGKTKPVVMVAKCG